MYSLVALLLLAAVSSAFDPYDFMPCSFQVTTLTKVYSGGTEIASSEDALYRDHDNLWRWESDFSGLSGLFDAHSWVVVWRPDYASSFHHDMISGKCLKNNGGKYMYPYPPEWITSKVDTISWTQSDVTYNGKSAVMYTANGKNIHSNFEVVANLIASKDGFNFYGANGTVKSALIDLEFQMEVNQYVAYKPLASKLFQPSEPCTEVTIPAEPTKDFARLCYQHTPLSNPSSSNAGFAVNPSILAVLASVFALLMCIAL